MQTCYFDIKDGASIRDLEGLAFCTPAEAIEHSKTIARLVWQQPEKADNFLIVVLNQSGTEIHHERV